MSEQKRQAPDMHAAPVDEPALDGEQRALRDHQGRRVDLRQSALRDLHADVVRARQLALRRLTTQQGELYQSAVGVATGDALQIGPNSTAGVAAGRAVTLDQSRTPLVLAGRRARLDQSAAGVVLAQRVTLRQSAAGVVIALKVSGEVRPLLTGQAALIFGATFALALALLQLVVRPGQRRFSALAQARPDSPPAVTVVRRRLRVLSSE
jgi:hypothetical protein